MKCPICIKNGLKSKVFSKGKTTTTLGGGGIYWDEDGNPHYYDPNYHTYYYDCSNGHAFGMVTYDGKTWFGTNKFQKEEDRIYMNDDGTFDLDQPALDDLLSRQVPDLQSVLYTYGDDDKTYLISGAETLQFPKDSNYE